MRTFALQSLTIFALCLAVACSGEGEDDAGSSDAGMTRDASAADAFEMDATSTDATASDVGFADAGALDAAGQDATVLDGSNVSYDADLPILERAPRASVTCAATRAVTNHSPVTWEKDQSLAVTSGGTFFLARRQAPVTFDPSTLVMSTLTLGGVFGATSTVSDVAPDTISSPQLIASSTGLAMVWIESDAIQFVTFDAQGVRGTPHTLAGTNGVNVERSRIAAGTNGVGLVYSTRATSDDPAVLHYRPLDAQGVPTAAAVTLDTATEPYFLQGSTIIATQRGFAVAYRDSVAFQSTIYLVEVDSAGNVLLGPKRLSPVNGTNISAAGDAGFGDSSIGLLADGAGYIATWSESYEDPNFEDSYSIIRVARFDQQGDPLTPIYAMQRSVVDQDEIEPSLHRIGSAVALLWAEGEHIYFCAGCFPRHHTEMVLLDPSDLTPVSNVLEIANVGPNGTLRRSSAVLGNDMLLTLHLMTHVSSFPATATVHCQ